ncbi:hypothetical protein ACG74X_08045 [Marivita sp. S0852]|uniref:hypothetical protein n=1 Tax=Marivita sp. S0852 TaxID=3373893 RepID=UPI003981E8CE
MIARLKSAFSEAPVLTSAFVVAFAVMLWFGGHFVARAIYWSDPDHQNQEIASWMTLGYVGQSWQVPREELAAALSDIWTRDGPGRPPPIEKIARQAGVPDEEIITLLEAAIDAHRATAADQP